MNLTQDNNREQNQPSHASAESLLQVRGLTIHHRTDTGERLPAVESSYEEGWLWGAIKETVGANAPVVVLWNTSW